MIILTDSGISTGESNNKPVADAVMSITVYFASGSRPLVHQSGAHPYIGGLYCPANDIKRAGKFLC
jgi:hypothetical protein